MKDIEFFSSNKYLFLPTNKNPKVALVVDDKLLVKNSFKLYNPFSKKAKFLKKVTQTSFISCNSIFKKLFSIQKEKSLFINYLEELLDESLVISIYFATAKDKVVLQLQSKDAKILGYVKFPLNQIGIKHIKNEINAIEILSKKRIIDSCLLNKMYNDIPFMFLKELDGDIEVVEDNVVQNVVQKFKRDKSYKLAVHPRILSLKTTLKNLNMLESLDGLNELCLKSELKYHLVYEHGDFAPWNIIRVKNDYIPFDFEYFIEDGLEYLDFIKYYHQIGALLQGKSDLELKKYISQKTDFEEFDVIYNIFLIKEEMIKRLENI